MSSTACRTVTEVTEAGAEVTEDGQEVTEDGQGVTEDGPQVTTEAGEQDGVPDGKVAGTMDGEDGEGIPAMSSWYTGKTFF